MTGVLTRSPDQAPTSARVSLPGHRWAEPLSRPPGAVDGHRGSRHLTSAGLDPAGRVIRCGADRSATSPSHASTAEERVRRETMAATFAEIVSSIRTLATLRGHVLGAPLREANYTVTMQCSRCTRWATIALDDTRLNGRAARNSLSEGDLGITGQVLGVCRGKVWGPLAAEEMSTGLQPSLSRTGGYVDA